jgi:hypothetical protein
MRPCYPWLSQGDVFNNVPVIFSRLDVAGRVHFAEEVGPAMLLTEGCALDRRQEGNSSIVRRLQFAPLRAVDSFSPRARELLHQLQINPPEAIYLDDVAGQDAVVLLGDAYPIPAAYLRPELRDFSGHQEIAEGTDAMRLVATTDPERICTMGETERLLLHDKMTVYWTYRRAEGPTLFDVAR